RLTQAELLGHVQGQDGAHAVIRATFRELPPEEKPECLRMAREKMPEYVADRQSEWDRSASHIIFMHFFHVPPTLAFSRPLLTTIEAAFDYISVRNSAEPRKAPTPLAALAGVERGFITRTAELKACAPHRACPGKRGGVQPNRARLFSVFDSSDVPPSPDASH